MLKKISNIRIVSIDTPLGRWQAGLVTTLITLLVVCSFLRLSYWQYMRSLEKTQWSIAHAQLKEKIKNSPLSYQQALDLWPKVQTNLASLPIQVNGHFLNSGLIFHDNRTLNNQAGYHTYAWFQPVSGPNLLVNFGFLPWPKGERALLPPVLTLPVGKKISLAGKIMVLNPAFTLKKDTQKNCQTAMLLQTIDINQLRQNCQKQLAPFSILLEPDSFTTKHARNINQTLFLGTTAEKHQGYAIQWLIFAVIALGLWIKLNF
jgi:surfeit locus 1 family protein